MSFSTASFAIPALDRVSLDREMVVGTVVNGTDGTRYVYVQASGVITAGQAVAIDAGQAAPLTATNAITGVDIGVANVAFAANEYGFVQTRGATTVDVAAAAAADVQLYATATPGTLDDAGTVTLAGISLTSAESGGQATAHLSSEVHAL